MRGVGHLYAATDEAQARGYDAGRFSFNVPVGRCETCQGEGFVAVELLVLPGTYAPCPTCHGARYDHKTLEITYRGKNIAEVLLDEPTSGLHPADTALLLRQLHRLVDAGNTVVLAEHDLDAIAIADWVIDLGPGG